MASTIPPPCDRFFSNLMFMKGPILVALSQCKTSSLNADLVEAAFGFIGFLSHQELLDSFIEKTNMHWTSIAKCTDVAPVLENVLAGFPELGKERVDEILRVVKNKEVDSAVQKQLLDLARSLVKIAIRHLQGCVDKSAIDVPAMATLYQLK